MSATNKALGATSGTSVMAVIAGIVVAVAAAIPPIGISLAVGGGVGLLATGVFKAATKYDEYRKRSVSNTTTVDELSKKTNKTKKIAQKNAACRSRIRAQKASHSSKSKVMAENADELVQKRKCTSKAAAKLAATTQTSKPIPIQNSTNAAWAEVVNSKLDDLSRQVSQSATSAEVNAITNELGSLRETLEQSKAGSSQNPSFFQPKPKSARSSRPPTPTPPSSATPSPRRATPASLQDAPNTTPPATPSRTPSPAIG